MSDLEVAIRAENLRVQFRVGRRALVALDGVSLSARQGESLAIVGESGSGKSTLARTLMRLITPTHGRIWIGEEEITNLSKRQLKPYWRSLQMIFQNPYASLDPNWTVDRIIAEPLALLGTDYTAVPKDTVQELLALVGLSGESASRTPRQFSGGQRQRIAIARALAPNPRILIADEPVSALDVSVQAQIMNLLRNLQLSRGLTLILICHDLALVNRIADRVLVMYLGTVVEEGPAQSVISAPAHPYTAALVSAVPTAGKQSGQRRRIVLDGEPPSPMAIPRGCRFHVRCPIARSRCGVDVPQLQAFRDRLVACHFPDEVAKIQRT